MKGTEVQHLSMWAKDTGEVEEMVLIREANGLLFAMSTSYVEQSVDVIKSPYNNGTVMLDDGEEDLSNLQGDVLSRLYGDAHPEYSKTEWKEKVLANETEQGYWDWVSGQLIDSSGLLAEGVDPYQGVEEEYQHTAPGM